MLVVDSYKASDDWLPLDYLLGAIPPDGSVNVLWLGADAATETSPLFEDLRGSGTLVTDKRGLSEIVASLAAAGEFVPNELPVLYEPGIVSFRDGAFVEVAPALRLRVEASAAIVDDDWSKPPSPLSRESEADLFSTLHGGPPSARALVEGVVREFYIVRDFEESLQGRVSQGLTRQISREAVLVLHGQSGTGKSVAMARLALVARTVLRLPVVAASDRVPEAADVDPFCDLIDRAGLGPTLVLCDCNTSPERYFALSSALRSRGRRHLIVGTSYRQEVGESTTSHLIEAPEATSQREWQALKALVVRFANGVDLGPALEGEHVLALLYRFISAGRPRISYGLSGEARFTEGLLRDRAQRVRSRPKTQLAQKLLDAGVVSGEEQLFETVDSATQDGDAPGRLIDYVMAAGRVGVAVPLNLLLRALRTRIEKLDYLMISELFQGLDLFRWHSGDHDKSDLLVGPRLRLEAELICRRRLAGIDQEMECLIDLIEAVRVRGVDGDAELLFLLDLLQRLDRDGPRSGSYAAGYLRVGESLTRLRAIHGVEDASLMLQESNFRRAWLWSRVTDTQVAFADRDRVLNEAREAVEYAIGRIENNQLRAGRRTRENLYVERASIYGFLAVGHARAQEKPAVVWSDYLAARVAVRRAMGIAPNYFPFDVGLWTPADVFREAADDLSAAQRAELMADIYSTLDRVDPQDLSPDQRQRFNVRRAKVATTLNDSRLQSLAWSDLERDSPQVATFLRARTMAAEVFGGSDEIDRAGRENARLAAGFLEERRGEFGEDLRCLRLLLELRWIAETGQRLLRDEKRRIPFERSVRTQLLSIVGDVRQASGELTDAPMRYLEAVLHWVLSNTREATEIWRGLSRDTEFEDRRRVFRRLLVCDTVGQPLLYRGRLAEERTQGHWALEVEGQAGRVDLLERDFRGFAFRLGAEVRDFRIAFNYLGPIADPQPRPETAR